MNTAYKAVKWTLLCAAMAGYAAPRQAAAQEPAPAPAPAAGGAVTQSSHSSAQAEAGEPRADTSMSPTPTAAAAPEAPAAAKPADSGTQHAPPAAVRAGASRQKAPATGRLELGTATVTGDREQPKVMYIVPWKRSDIGDLSGKPMNSLLDEALAPIDRDEFKREVIYYQAVKSDASQNGASRQPAKQGEK